MDVNPISDWKRNDDPPEWLSISIGLIIVILLGAFAYNYLNKQNTPKSSQFPAQKMQKSVQLECQCRVLP